MKNQKLKTIEINGNTYGIDNDHKQGYFPYLGIIIDKSDLVNNFISVLDFESIEKIKTEEKRVKAVNQALETFFHINLISKHYLSYISSHIEAKLKSFFKNVVLSEISETQRKREIKKVNQDVIKKFFSSKRKYNDFYYRYLSSNGDIILEKLIANMTFGGLVFTLKRMKDEYIINFFNNYSPKKTTMYKYLNDSGETEINIKAYKKMLDIARGLRNYVVHNTLIINEIDIITIFKDITLDRIVENNNEVMDIIFESLSFCLKDVGYETIRTRLSRHIDRELKDKNSSKFRNEKKCKLSLRYIHLFNFYEIK